MSQQKWVRRSLTYIARQLAKRKFRIGPNTVRRLLKKLKYSLCGNRKSLTGPSHPDRDKQFRYIRRVKKLFLSIPRKRNSLATFSIKVAVGHNKQSKSTSMIFVRMHWDVRYRMVSMT